MTSETPRDRLQLATEVALAVVSIAAVLSMHRLFVDGSYRAPLVLYIVAAHTTVAVARRVGLRMPMTVALAAVGALLPVRWLPHRDTTFALIPTPETLTALGDDLGGAWRTFREVRAPAPVEDGFLVATGVALWAIALIADRAALRSRVEFEALLPALTLFFFAAMLGGPGAFVATAVAFAAAALGFILVHRTWRQERSARWVASHRAHGRWSLISTGVVLAAAALVVGAAAGPNLPGAGAPAVWELRDLRQPGSTRIVVSPMVDMQTRLVRQPDVEAFTVRTTEPSYWRLTALDQFDGEIWRSSYGTADAQGALPRSTDNAESPTETVTQTFTIDALGAVWLPAAYEPVAVDAGDHSVDWDSDSSTLMVDREAPTSDGFSYEVHSEVARWSAEELRRAPAEVPDDIAGRYLDLPDLDPAVTELAAQLTADEPTPYDAALSLQDHLRSFTYDLDVGNGHSADALATFLFETQRGYCEQFAGAFAVLARAAGLPARVAVGFTKGIQDPDDPTLFHVRGRHAHAWAEVYLSGHGWVTFDPTPNRGPPGARQWLDVPEEQVSASGDGTTATTEAASGGPTGEARDGRTSIDDREAPNTAGRTDIEAAAPQRRPDSQPSFVDRMRVALTVAALAAALYLTSVPLLLAGQRSRRRRGASSPGDQLRLHWRTTVGWAADAGVPVDPSMTVAESARCIAAALPGAAEAVRQLADTVERSAYAEVSPSPTELAAANAAQTLVARHVRRSLTWGQRAMSHLDVRRLRRGSR